MLHFLFSPSSRDEASSVTVYIAITRISKLDLRLRGLFRTLSKICGEVFEKLNLLTVVHKKVFPPINYT